MADPAGPENLQGPAETAGATTDPARVFISYASPDAAVADMVCAALEYGGISCWIAPRNVVPGEFYADAIVHALNSTKIIVWILSQSAAGSPHVLREVERASSKRHPVVSLRTDLAPLPASLEYFLNTSHWLDASATGLERATPKLVEAVRHLLGPASVAVPAAPKPALYVPQSAPPLWRRGLLAVAAAALAMVAVAAYLAFDKPWLATEVTEQKPVAAVTTATPAATPSVPERSISVLPFID